MILFMNRCLIPSKSKARATLWINFKQKTIYILTKRQHNNDKIKIFLPFRFVVQSKFFENSIYSHELAKFMYTSRTIKL